MNLQFFLGVTLGLIGLAGCLQAGAFAAAAAWLLLLVIGVSGCLAVREGTGSNKFKRDASGISLS